MRIKEKYKTHIEVFLSVAMFVIASVWLIFPENRRLEPILAVIAALLVFVRWIAPKNFWDDEFDYARSKNSRIKQHIVDRRVIQALIEDDLENARKFEEFAELYVKAPK